MGLGISSVIKHGTIIQTVITCKKICYVRNSACGWLIVESPKILCKVMLNIFEFSHA